MANRSIASASRRTVPAAKRQGMSSEDCGLLIGRVDEARGILRLVKEVVFREAGSNKDLTASFSAIDATRDILNRVRDSLEAEEVRS